MDYLRAKVALQLGFVGRASDNSCAVEGTNIATLGDGYAAELADVLSRYGLRVDWVEPGAVIPGSYWGGPEAGLLGNSLFVRADTPVHSALHEGCHYVCMTPERRQNLNRDAGGDDLEETAVCYLQIVLSDFLSGFGRSRIFLDMDAWGYSFRLGSTQSWFENDAEDAGQWLRCHGLIDGDARPRWRLRV